MDFRLIWTYANGLDLLLNKIGKDQHINEKESSRNRNGLEVYFHWSKQIKINCNGLQMDKKGLEIDLNVNHG